MPQLMGNEPILGLNNSLLLHGPHKQHRFLVHISTIALFDVWNK